MKCTHLICDVCRVDMRTMPVQKTLPSETFITRGREVLDLCDRCRAALDDWIAGRKPASAKAAAVKKVMETFGGVLVEDPAGNLKPK